MKLMHVFFLTFLINTGLMAQQSSYGIKGATAPNWNIPLWIDENGQNIEPISLDDLGNKVKVIYGFQSWCPGCHSHGLPALQKLVETFSEKKGIAFLAIQTVFEGHHVNTFDKLRETQLKYGLKIPFAHDPGDETTYNHSNFMFHYRTRGTPWFIVIDSNNEVVFNDYHISVENMINFLQDQLLTVSDQ